MKTEKMKKEEYMEEEEEVQVLVDPDTGESLRKKYSFFVNNEVSRAIFHTGILLENHDENWMTGQWFVLSARSLASSLSFQPEQRPWSYANTDPNCLVHVNGEEAKRIFQDVPMPQAII